ncbi:OsmC family protein [Caulobacter endophyticus]|uniref:Osmotically inducible protein C n=1 Tax=Caulobacter endophyticus TaxID=2172652 RepID=A0A2T9KDF0_9CAUL|nr:OsmC family protein [Caulobacter endophyticus]PVM93972.1 osmotically inducible protein C [Caulobacter endophyticus]
MASRVHAVTANPRHTIQLDVNGHKLVGDEPPALGGQDAGPPPFGFVLAGLAACTATTLRMYADRKGWGEVTIETTLTLDNSGDKPRIDRKVSATGDLDEAAIARLRDVVERTPVTLALKGGFGIDTVLDRG